jgi:GH24 family phage-related lysozyme (muramidase)
MGKKIIRINENNLVKMISNIVYEEYGEDALASVLQKILTFKKPEDTQVSGIEAQSGDTQSQNKELTSVSDSEYKQKVIDLLAGYEGFKATAYPDGKEGDYAIGFGSHNIDGIPVKPGDTITKEKAFQQKSKDIDTFKNTIIKQIGQTAWNNLDMDTRVVLTSIAYNYGRIPNDLLGAVKRGDKSEIHDVIKYTLSRHNSGINYKRRNDEANILATGQSKNVPNYNV